MVLSLCGHGFDVLLTLKQLNCIFQHVTVHIFPIHDHGVLSLNYNELDKLSSCNDVSRKMVLSNLPLHLHSCSYHYADAINRKDGSISARTAMSCLIFAKKGDSWSMNFLFSIITILTQDVFDVWIASEYIQNILPADVVYFVAIDYECAAFYCFTVRVESCYSHYIISITYLVKIL